jgi:hypothetical protein
VIRSSSPTAERMRIYRKRRRRGLRCVRLQVGQAELDELVAKGYLAAADRAHVEAIESAIDDFMFDWLHCARTL